MSKSQQRKGRNAEIELSEILNSHGFHTHPGRALSFGIEPDVTGVQGIHIECKRHEKPALTAWLKQSQEDAERFMDGLPVVIHRQSRQPWIVSMSIETFTELYKKGFLKNE